MFSVPSNIVEGCARESQTEYLRFLEIAFASLRDLHYLFNLAALLIYISESDAIACEPKLEEMKKIFGLLARVLMKKCLILQSQITYTPTAYTFNYA